MAHGFNKIIFLSSPKDMLIFFYLNCFLLLILERGEGREIEGEKHQCKRDKTLMGCLLHKPQLGTETATYAYVP